MAGAGTMPGCCRRRVLPGPGWPPPRYLTGRTSRPPRVRPALGAFTRPALAAAGGVDRCRAKQRDRGRSVILLEAGWRRAATAALRGPASPIVRPTAVPHPPKYWLSQDESNGQAGPVVLPQAGCHETCRSPPLGTRAQSTVSQGPATGRRQAPEMPGMLQNDPSPADANRPWTRGRTPVTRIARYAWPSQGNRERDSRSERRFTCVTQLMRQ
jgi:hypothetical protein